MSIESFGVWVDGVLVEPSAEFEAMREQIPVAEPAPDLDAALSVLARMDPTKLVQVLTLGGELIERQPQLEAAAARITNTADDFADEVVGAVQVGAQAGEG